MSEEQKNTEQNRICLDENKYTLDLVNHWIDAADTKIEIAFGIFSVVFAVLQILIGTNLNTVKNNCMCWYYVLLVLTILAIVCFTVGLVFFFFALKPKFTCDNKECKYSIFYDEIKSFPKVADFVESTKAVSKDQFNEEIIKEIYYNSKICSRKMHIFGKGLTISSISILIGTLVSIAVLIL